MSLVEIGPEIALEDAIEHGQSLSVARDALSDAVTRPAGKDQAFFETIVPEYLNNIQRFWYEQSPEKKYEVISELPRLIKLEMSLIFDSVEPIETIQDRIKQYDTDETATELRNSGMSHYPRTTTMVMLDMIDEYRHR